MAQSMCWSCLLHEGGGEGGGGEGNGLNMIVASLVDDWLMRAALPIKVKAVAFMCGFGSFCGRFTIGFKFTFSFLEGKKLKKMFMVAIFQRGIFFGSRLLAGFDFR